MPITTAVGTPQQIDQCRHQHETAADTQNRTQKTDRATNENDWQDADIDLGFLEPHLDGSPWIQLCWPGRRMAIGVPLRARTMALTLSMTISEPTAPRKVT